MSEHQQFVELCAYYTSGSISDEQLKQLDAHLEGCLDCRRALEEFQEIASMGLPSLAPDFAALSKDNDTEVTEDRAQRRLLARIENEIAARRPRPVAFAAERPVIWNGVGVISLFRSARTPLPYAAGILLLASVGVCSYHLGARRIANASQPKLKQIQTQADSLQIEVARLSDERAALNSKLQESSSRAETLTSVVNSRLAEIASLKEQNRNLGDSANGAEAKRAASEADRANLNRKLVETQASLDAAQKALDTARNERTIDVVQVADLERRLNETSEILKDREQTIQQQRDLLAYDRDIRDLIGARDLYVAEVNDVDRNAETKAPFGRVFFTKGKSLIFYAYDLDKQPGLKRAAAFQAWGRRGTDFEQALPLGILYLDNSSNRRWVLRLDDPKTIAKIDAVFVTVEPKGGSQKPSSKPLLFAYLKVAPNHP
jgi:predicted  nucleic acid-binding Zn-ribbon protein